MAQIIAFSFDFSPKGYSLCNGQLLAISQNQALFALLGTTYGGNGTQTFGLPDLRGRTPVSWQQGPGLSNYVLGEATGTEKVTLLYNNLPSHQHGIKANNTAPTTAVPSSSAFLAVGPTITSGGTSTAINFYSTSVPNATMNTSTALGATGGGQGAPIMQPFTVVSFAIAIQGIFPSRN